MMSEVVAAIHTPAPPATLVQWWVIVKKRETLQLHLLDLSTSQTGATIMHILRKKYDSIRPSHPWWLTQPKISEAIVSPYCIGDPEVQDYPREIFLRSKEYRPDLTDAFHNPNVLRCAANLIHLNEHFNILRGRRAPGHGDASYSAILITNDANKCVLMWVIVAMVLASIIVGIVAGILVDSSFGVAMSTGLIALFCLIQGCIFAADK
ncbi:hypothetical protein BDZ45DRAFT_799010 [Acephala macrosclerotiorum]|nr:hypothetical protein BDZ45DRAFT_799010 [Acephala macrosclerotiorum]